VERRLAELRASTERIPDLDVLEESLEPLPLAVVLVEPLGKKATLDLVKAVRSLPAGAHLPVFVLVPSAAPRRVISLYRAGVTAVFEWPREARIFPHVLTELLGIEVVHGRATKSDLRLARSVRARLRSCEGVSGAVRIRAAEGVVRVSGDAASLWEKEETRRLISSTPGVRGVRLDDLRVRPSAIPDRQLTRFVRQVVRAAADSEDTLATSVENGYVVLAGTVASRAELDRIHALLTNVRGVRGIECLATVSPGGRPFERVRAREVRQGLRRMFPSEQQASVAVFGPVAVLSGRVSTLEDKEQILSFVTRHPSVERVVSKLQVR
jgi:osmotically-inducible protein OsmY